VVFAAVDWSDREDGIPHDVALYAPEETGGLPLLRAVTGEELGTPDPAYVVIYGEDNELRGDALLLVSALAEGPYELQADPEQHTQLVDINGNPGLLTDNPANDHITLSWQPSNDRQLTVIGQGLDAAQLATAARSVTGDLHSVSWPDPARFGLHEIVQGPSAELAPSAVAFEPVWGGAVVAYGRQDGRGPQLQLVTGGGEQLAVATARIQYEEAQDAIVTGHDAVVARLGPNAEDPIGWIVTWLQDDGAVIRVLGYGMSRATVVAAAESVHLISGEEFRDLARRAER
jgi:hypothetical protein